MSKAPSPHSNEFYVQLRDYRDTAFVASNLHRKRKQLGKLSFGTAEAYWKTADGGFAYLIDQGLRFGGMGMQSHPTRLYLSTSHGDMGTETVTFDMDLDDVGIVDVYRSLVVNPASTREIRQARLARQVERKLGLENPTDEEMMLLYTEMHRGATGQFGVMAAQEVDD